MKTEDQELVAVARGAAAVLCALHELGVDGQEIAAVAHIRMHQAEVRSLLLFAFKKIAEHEFQEEPNQAHLRQTHTASFW